MYCKAVFLEQIKYSLNNEIVSYDNLNTYAPALNDSKHIIISEDGKILFFIFGTIISMTIRI